MPIRTLKLFVIGPHNESRYKLIRSYIERVVKARDDAQEIDVSVVTPEQNPQTDRFNDWIFGQIDTCDLLVADLTDFNPNVIYEVAFAHSIGVPCAYLRIGKEREDGQVQNDIKHYFRFTLLPSVTEQELRKGRNEHFDGQLDALFKPATGETILSDYYRGVSPVDAEFVRGLAEGYYRNFLQKVLKEKPPKSQPNIDIKILIPDTFERPDEQIITETKKTLGKAFPDSIKSTGSNIPKNSFYRILMMAYAAKASTPFVYDIPTTLLTITKSSKYKKVKEATYFKTEDRDRLTDRMARKFSENLRRLIFENSSETKWPLKQLHIDWLSKEIGSWDENSELMNTVPLARPHRL